MGMIPKSTNMFGSSWTNIVGLKKTNILTSTFRKDMLISHEGNIQRIANLSKLAATWQ